MAATCYQWRWRRSVAGSGRGVAGSGSGDVLSVAMAAKRCL